MTKHRRERKTVRVQPLTANEMLYGVKEARALAVEQLQADYEAGMLERALKQTQRMPPELVAELLEASR